MPENSTVRRSPEPLLTGDPPPQGDASIRETGAASLRTHRSVRARVAFARGESRFSIAEAGFRRVANEALNANRNGAHDMTAHDDLSALSKKPYSDAVEKFGELLRQGVRAFLIGAGCSRCAGLPMTAELTQETIESEKLDEPSKAILMAVKDHFAGSTNSNIEDYLSELVDLLAIVERRDARRAAQPEVSIDGKKFSASQLRTAAEHIKEALVSAIDKQVDIETHRMFIRAVHRPLRVGKATRSSIVDYIVLNYDTVVEDALAVERIPFSDGIDGGETGWWAPETFDRDGLRARVLKLHGSVNWSEVDGDPLPRRIARTLQIQDMRQRRILIWPASTKYRETQLDPSHNLQTERG